MKLKQIAAMSLSELRSMSSSDLKLAYKRTREAVLARQATFEKRGMPATALPKVMRGEIPTAGSFSTPAELRHALKDLSSVLMEERSYYSGYRKERQEQFEKYNASPWAKSTGLHFSSVEEFEEYGRFMGDMEKRAQGMWLTGGSEDAGDIYKEAKRLGVDPKQFMKNFEYWREHIKDLKSAKRLNRKELNASDYRLSLGLENITSFYDREGYDRMYYANSKKKKRK